MASNNRYKVNSQYGNNGYNNEMVSLKVEEKKRQVNNSRNTIDEYQKYKGEIGPKGDKGDKGEQGEVGPKGDKGDKGEQGEVGPKGDKGDKGEQGEVGPKGDKGDKGEQGEVGPKGDKGDRGIDGALFIKDNAYLVQTESIDIDSNSIITFDTNIINGENIKIEDEGHSIILKNNGTYFISYTISANCIERYAVGLRIDEALIKGSISYCEKLTLTSISNSVIYMTGDNIEKLELYNFGRESIKLVANAISIKIIKIA
ncbi:hypothetical protein [Romboutsia sp.]|uniref:hypothetical protein n=1 Tax=Romboutsia sp. TaxID=1965302 RepID=UPI003F361071